MKEATRLQRFGYRLRSSAEEVVLTLLSPAVRLSAWIGLKRRARALQILNEVDTGAIKERVFKRVGLPLDFESQMTPAEYLSQFPVVKMGEPPDACTG